MELEDDLGSASDVEFEEEEVEDDDGDEEVAKEKEKKDEKAQTRLEQVFFSLL